MPVDLAPLNEGATPLSTLTHVATYPLATGATLDEYKLGNGLAVYLLPHDAAPTVSVQTWVHVGSRHEETGKTGLAHFFEHLMFGATDTYKDGAYAAQLEAIGAQINADTHYDRTRFYVNARAEHLPAILALEATRFSRLRLDDAAVTRERDVVANERRMRVEDDTMGAAFERLYAEAFQVHGYGHPVIGTMADILAYNPADAARFYRTHYAPNNLALILAGDFEPERALRLIQAHYGGMEPAELPVEQVRPEPTQTAERHVVMAKPIPTERMLLGYRAPACMDADALPLQCLAFSLSVGEASLLREALVDTGHAVQAHVWVDLLKDPGLLCGYLEPRPETPRTLLLRHFDDVLAAVAERGLSEERLTRAKRLLALTYLDGLQTAADWAEALGHQVVMGGLFLGPEARLRELDRVSRADILRVARRYLVPSTRTVVHVLPLTPDTTPEA